MEDSTIKAVTGMLCITIIEAVALASGINGIMLSLVVIALAGIAGYELKAMRG